MSDDAEILRLVQATFDRCERPEHFTNYTHCEECAEHDELLRARTNDTLRMEDVGNPGWDPLCYVGPDGFGYFFPALARLTLSEPDQTHGWYGWNLLFHLTNDAKANRHLKGFTPDQRRAVVSLLQHVAETRAALIDANLCSDDLLHALQLWSEGDEEVSSA